MGTLLEGRVHLDANVFHQQNHHVPFIVYLGIIDLMQPYVLKNFKLLKTIFSLYLKLFNVSLYSLKFLQQTALAQIKFLNY